MAQPATIWVVTDGKAGDLAQSEGLAAALGGRAERRDVRARRPWSYLAPWGPPDPADDPRRPGSRFAPPFPDIAVATGRRAVPVLRRLHAAGSERPFTVFLKDPRCDPAVADLVWVPEHDALRGPNVITTLTGPHRFSAARLREIRRAPPPFGALPRPLLGVILGGPARGTRYSEADVAGLAAALERALPTVGSIVATPSRRTSEALAAAVRAVAGRRPGLFWDGTGENPLPALLALSDALVVTGDSHNMVSEALAAGVPVHVVRPSALNPRIAPFLDLAAERKLIRPLASGLAFGRQEPVDATPELAARVLTAYSRFRA